MRSKSEEIRAHANECMLRQRRVMNGEHPLDKRRKPRVSTGIQRGCERVS